jgi:TPR repeat protein
VVSARFSPDGRLVVTGGEDSLALIWDSATGKELMRLSGHTNRLETADFSPDGRRAVTAGDDNTARVWDVATGQELVRLIGHTNAVTYAAFSPDGARVVTASLDKTARVWDVATGRELLLLRGHEDRLVSALYSRDGQRILTASFDASARVWNAHAVPLDTQLDWAWAAQFDPLPANERFQLGLPEATNVRQWPADHSPCDESAAAPYDPDRRAPGVSLNQISADIAVAACANTQGSSDRKAIGRTLYQHGRALMAKGDFTSARQELERAVADDYRSAYIDLALLLSQPSFGSADLNRAVSLYRQSWREGVSIAAFELGQLFENGVKAPDPGGKALLEPDLTRAWSWYQQGADKREPSALARFGERHLTAFTTEDGEQRNLDMLEAFKYYAAASAQAQEQSFPEDVWQAWRYHRASLARALAGEGKTQQVADAYNTAVVVR